MYAGSTYAGAPYAGLLEESLPSDDTILLPLIGNTATAFAPSFSPAYPEDPESPIFDPEDPEYIPGAEPGEYAGPYGISVELVDLANDAIPLTGTWGREWQDQLMTDGTGSCQMDSTTAVEGLSVLRFSLHGVKAFQSVVDEITEVETHQGEEHEQILTLRGRGAISLLENGAVWQTAIAPSLGIDSKPLSDVRYFNFAEVLLDDNNWGGAYATPPDYDGANLFGRPKGMKDGTGGPLAAKWVWGHPGGVPGPAGDCYFRQYFDYDGPPRVVRLEAAADDELELWVDGVPILEILGVYAGGMKWTTFELTPGQHLVAVRGRNRNALRAGIIWSIGTMDSKGRFLDVIAHSVSGIVSQFEPGQVYGNASLDYTGNPGYPPPGFTIGRAWRILLLECFDRGEITYIGDTIDELVDANGTPWPVTSELSVRLDQSMLEVARAWGETYWDIVMAPYNYDLKACLKGQLGTDIPVSWDAGDQLLLSQRVKTSAPTVALIRYDGGRTEVEHPDVATKGRKVRAISLGHVKSEKQAQREGLAYLEAAKIRQETRAIQIDAQLDLTQDAYTGARVGDSPLVNASRLRVHGLNVTDVEDDYLVTPEVISAALTADERMFVSQLQMSPGSASGRSRVVKPAPDISFPAGQDGREFPLAFSWQEQGNGPVELYIMANDGTTEILVATLNPVAGAQGKVTIDPAVRINELTQVFLKIDGEVSQQKRTDEGIWIVEFRVDRDVDDARGTADVYIA